MSKYKYTLDKDYYFYVKELKFAYFKDEYFECIYGNCILKKGYSWNKWILTNYTITEYEGYSYFLSYSGTGNSLTDLELMQLWSTDYIELVDELPELN